MISDIDNLTTENNFHTFLGVESVNALQLVRSIERGFAFEKLERVRRETGIPMELLAVSVGISSRTLSRRRKEKKLSPSESDRLVSVSRLLTLAVRLFENDKEKAFRWFRNPNRALGNLTPLEMAATETGSREVEDLIGRLEHGVFS